MKNLLFKLTVLSLAVCSGAAKAQSINWRSFTENQKQVVNVNAGIENGFTISTGYGYKMKFKFPTLISAEYSIPTGNNLFDDYKIRLGGQTEIYKIKNWSATVRVYGIFRRFQNELAILSNFGSEFSTALGYYKPRWFIAGEFGFDKAIVTRIKNSETMKQIYPEVKDGWYLPTGGNFFYGLQTGVSFGRKDVYLKAGKMTSQDLQSAPAFPIYVRLGVSHRF